MSLRDTLKDKAQRHRERRRPVDCQLAIADSVSFLNADDWDSVAENSSIFLSRAYRNVIESRSPLNTRQKAAIAYCDSKPVAIVACQIAETSGEQLLPAQSRAGAIASHYRERVLVCGNLVSSGLHGVGFAPDLDHELGWRIVAEVLYRIRRGEKLHGAIDFALIKDLTSAQAERIGVIERYSYRRIQTDPDMVLELPLEVTDFEGYLKILTSKYRSRIKKIRSSVDQAGYRCEALTVDDETDARLHALYLAVENRSAVRLATLPSGYYAELGRSLGDHFDCRVIRDDQDIVGFATIIRDGDTALAYYVGLDYAVNETAPIYFRLLQLVVESALGMGCRRVSFGRTALEPKACLGAKPVDSFVWARHRVPVVNYVLRKFFRNVPFDEAPERAAIKH